MNNLHTEEYPRVIDSSFERGSTTLDNLPDEDLFELALFGRSNVGKSTFLNRITSRKNLASTSSKPGHTQEFNVFRARVRMGEGDDRELRVVDLPGFGYSKFAAKKRGYLSRLTVDYIRSREPLRAVCLLNDIRREPEADELAIQKEALEAGRRFILVVTKLDKTKQGERKKLLTRLKDAYRIGADDLVEAGEGIPVTSFWRSVLSQ